MSRSSILPPLQHIDEHLLDKYRRSPVRENLTNEDDRKKLPEDIKRLLDTYLYDKNDYGISISQDGDGYTINFPEHTVPFMEKQVLQQLVGHPNFKGMKVLSIGFKNDSDLATDQPKKT